MRSDGGAGQGPSPFFARWREDRLSVMPGCVTVHAVRAMPQVTGGRSEGRTVGQGDHLPRMLFRGESRNIRVVPGGFTPAFRTVRCTPGELVVAVSRRCALSPGEVLVGWLFDRAREDLTDRVLVRGTEMGVSPKRLSVRGQRTRWGCCTGRGTVTLNWRLVLAPPGALDYVVVHELAHLSEPHHRPPFWRRVELFCPEWRHWRTWLRDFGPGLTVPELPPSPQAETQRRGDDRP